MADRTDGFVSDTLEAPFAPIDVGAGLCSPRIDVQCGSRVLDRLDRDGRGLIEPHLEYTALVEGQVLEEEGHRPPFLYFPIKGAVSVEVRSGKNSLQLALVGRDGLVGTSLLLGGVPIGRASVQFEGTAWRLSADALVTCLEQSPRLHGHLLLGVNDLLRQLSLTAVGAGCRTIENRIASWLLDATKCLDTDRIPITHDVVATALGVRRASVTVAMHCLEREQAIRPGRGYVRILDRKRLAAIAAP